MKHVQCPSLTELRRHILKFRGARPRRRLSEELWRAAVQTAQEHGVSKVSQAIRVGYYTLKARMGSNVPPTPSSGVEFLELPRSVIAPGPACVLELQDPRGTRLRAELRDLAAAEVLARAFWSHRG